MKSDTIKGFLWAHFEEEKELLQWRKNTVWVSLRFFEMWLKGLDSETSMQ